jgi:hypothetical protein
MYNNVSFVEVNHHDTVDILRQKIRQARAVYIPFGPLDVYRFRFGKWNKISVFEKVEFMLGRYGNEYEHELAYRVVPRALHALDRYTDTPPSSLNHPLLPLLLSSTDLVQVINEAVVKPCLREFFLVLAHELDVDYGGPDDQPRQLRIANHNSAIDALVVNFFSFKNCNSGANLSDQCIHILQTWKTEIEKLGWGLDDHEAAVIIETPSSVLHRMVNECIVYPYVLDVIHHDLCLPLELAKMYVLPKRSPCYKYKLRPPTDADAATEAIRGAVPVDLDDVCTLELLVNELALRQLPPPHSLQSYMPVH